MFGHAGSLGNGVLREYREPGSGALDLLAQRQERFQTLHIPGVPGSDTLECAYDYGWYGALDSYQKAVDAQITAGLTPAGSTRTSAPAQWWLDVETINSWRDPLRNIEVLRGAVAALEAVGAARVGFYSSPSAWQTVTANTQLFAGYATWLAGGDTSAAAAALCGGDGFTGGGVALSQYLIRPILIDGDIQCPVTVALAAEAQQGAGAVTPIGLSVNVVQGAATQVVVTSNLTPPYGLSLSPTGPWQATLAVDLLPRTRRFTIYSWSRKAGAYRVTAAALGQTPSAVVTVTPGPASRVAGITGAHRIRRGQRKPLTVIVRDSFRNRITAGIVWRSSNPAVLKIITGPNGTARMVGRRPGTVTVRARSGQVKSPTFRVVVS
jgi:hypothetical protein